MGHSMCGILVWFQAAVAPLQASAACAFASRCRRRAIENVCPQLLRRTADAEAATNVQLAEELLAAQRRAQVGRAGVCHNNRFPWCSTCRH